MSPVTFIPYPVINSRMLLIGIVLWIGTCVRASTGIGTKFFVYQFITENMRELKVGPSWGVGFSVFLTSDVRRAQKHNHDTVRGVFLLSGQRHFAHF